MAMLWRVHVRYVGAAGRLDLVPVVRRVSVRSDAVRMAGQRMGMVRHRVRVRDGSRVPRSGNV